MSNESILKEIQALAKTLGDTASEGLENSRKTQFYKEILKDIAFQVFEKAQQIEQAEKEVLKKEPDAPKIQAEIKPEKTAEPELPKEEIKAPVAEVKPVAPEVPPQPEIKTPAPVPVAEPVIVPAAPVQEPVPAPVPPPLPRNEEKIIPAEKPQAQPSQPGDDVHSKLSKNYQQMNLADKHKETPIPDLPKAISISKKFEFINALFDGNPEIYKETIAGVEISGSYDNAVKMLEEKVFPGFDWSDNEQLASEFMNLIKRRYM